MRKRSINLLMATLLVGFLAACEDDITGPGSRSVESTMLELAVDPEFTDAIVTDAEAAIDAAVGVAPSAVVSGGALFSVPDETDVEAARELLRQAREKFALARQAYEEGRLDEARQLALEGRLLVAQALLLVFGDEAYERLCERVLNIISWLEEGVDEGTSDLVGRIRQLKEEAEAAWASGDKEVAVERLLLAMQAADRDRAHHRRYELRAHARLSIFMAHSAIGLAVEIIGDDATDEQVHALRHAEHLLMHAEEAFLSGAFRLAFIYAREASNLALVAVLLEPDTDVSRVRMMIEISERALGAAEDALASGEPTEVALRLFELAQYLHRRGVELAESEPRRAVHVLWHSATTSYGIVRLMTDTV